MKTSRIAPERRIGSYTRSLGHDLYARNVLLFSIGMVAWLIFSHAATAAAQNLVVSTAANRSNAVSLAGQNFSGNIYVYTSPETGVAKVSFYLDDPKMSGSPYQVEGYAPYDFAGSDSKTKAFPLDTTQLASGSHTITALIALSGGGNQVLQGTFTVGSGAAPSKTGSTTLSWAAPSARTDGTPLSLSAIAGYRVYHATGANQLSLLANIKDSTTTAYTASSLPAGTHKFAVTTYDVAGLESPKSRIISKSIQ
jgi:hypothetical protein